METFAEAILVVIGLLVVAVLLLMILAVAGLAKLTYDTFFGKDS